MSAEWTPDDDLPGEYRGLPNIQFIDDGRCQRTKLSICPKTYRWFVNRCTGEAGHRKTGCTFETVQAPEELPQLHLPGFHGT